jgi:hypothetical protein
MGTVNITIAKDGTVKTTTTDIHGNTCEVVLNTLLQGVGKTITEERTEDYLKQEIKA